VPSAFIRGSNEFKAFRYHRGLLKYGRKKCHKVVKKIVKKLSKTVKKVVKKLSNVVKSCQKVVYKWSNM
jgi:hypothetical protein